MVALRWILGLIVVLLGAGFVVLGIVAGGFRRSFGASERGSLVTLAPLAAMGLLLAGLVFPSCAPLLHAGAAAALALIAFCVWQSIAEAAVVTWFGVAYLVAWLAFYWLAVWKRPGG